MTDLTPTFRSLLQDRGSNVHSHRRPSPDEFLKEAYRINTHISSLLQYLHQTRPAYLSITQPTGPKRPKPSSPISPSPSPSASTPQSLTDPDRDNIDTSTSALLHDLSTSITTLSSAEALRHETARKLLHKKYGHGAAAALLWKWAGGTGLADDTSPDDTGKASEQRRAEETERCAAAVRESVLWFLRRGLDETIAVQRGMVERRIERIREKEKSVLYKSSAGAASAPRSDDDDAAAAVAAGAVRGQALDQAEVAAIEAELSPEQLQLFAEENESMVRYYEETLSKVQNAEKSLLEIASLQQTLVSHLATQEDYIGQLVSDAASTETNIGRGNKELKRATDRRSTAQAVFWGTVGLCTWLVVWDLIF
ncbi:hypothetical protein BDV59DRAFT_205357 [Aspergillus ambiguus]|uniref:putative SNARE protein (Ufe1) n=1 Tax=Aspergillus ambiguus TaxID=176160 RepID=UPI003CCE19F3